MKKLIYLIVVIGALALIVAGCTTSVVPPTEQGDLSTLTKNGEPTVVWVDDDWSGTSIGNPVNGHTFGTDAFATILDGINAVAVGGTVNVAAGTYTNDIWDSGLGIPASYRITKSVTLLGAQAGVDPQGSVDRGGESILVRTNGVPYSLYASGITIDGFTFTSGGGSGGGRLIIACDKDSVTIKNCIIKDISGTDPHGVWVCSTATNALIDKNTFSNTAWEAILCDGNAVISNNTIKNIPTNKGIVLGSSSSATVSDNIISSTYYEGIQAFASATITGNEISACWIGIQVRDSASGSTISGNTISNTTYEGIQLLVPATITGNDISECYHGIQIRNHATGTVIEWNNIHDNTYHGIEIPNYGGAEPEVTGATITNNIFTNNGFTGIKVGGGLDGSGININYNGFEGNVYFGVDSKIEANDPSLYVDATCNWWGDNSGPSGVGPGSGDAVSSNVDFNPWQAPSSSLVYTGAPQPDTSVFLEATLSDSTLAGISGMDVDFLLDDVPVGTATTGSDGVASMVIGSLAVGIYEVYAKTACDLESEKEYLAVYPMSEGSGFVTGGGWIDSPAGAYVSDPSAEGKANFGFVSKYKKGQSEPTGNTEFQFKAGNLNFHSDNYDWLVVAGDKAMYKGTGTVNGTGEYGFMLSATDSDPDQFRIKIQDKDNDNVIYDNKQDGNDGTELGGGQIIVHKGK